MQPYPGSTQMPQTQRPPAPASVLTAVKVMYVGAATSVLGIVIDILTVNSTKADIARHSKNMTASQISSTQHALVLAFIVGGVIGAALWILIARSCLAGKNGARITGTVLFAIATIDTVVGLAAPYAGAVKIWGVVVWIVAVTAIVFLWRRTSSVFFKA